MKTRGARPADIGRADIGRADIGRADIRRADIGRAAKAVVAVACVARFAVVAEAGPYDRDMRVAHLAAALDAMRAMAATASANGGGAAAFEREIHEAVRVKCGADKTLACMIDVAKQRCGSDAKCLAAADIVVTNQHAERDLVDESTRMRLVRTSTDYHAAVMAELRTRYAVLAAELSLAPADDNLAARIDRFCVERDRVARRCVPDAPSCLGTIAYQRCAAGLVWFVSVNKQQEAKP